MIKNEKIKKYYNDNINKYEDLLVKYSTVRRWYDLCKSRNEKTIEYIDKELKDLYKSNHQCKHLMEIIYLENIKEILKGEKNEDN